jgi:hypothetical protein
MIRFLLILFALLVSSPAQANEGAGLLYRDQNGALPKGLWRKQNRSEIIFLLQNLPAYSDSRAIQDIKHNMLLSYYDVSEIVNDVKMKEGEDLLTLRLQKLMEMGLWEDALKLYTNTTEDPGQNNKLAQIGLLLILNQRGLSTACLEEKVLFSRFSDTPFWKQIDAVCSIEMGITQGTDDTFPESSVLEAIFSDKNFKISAQDIETLESLTLLEISLLALKNRIKYDRIDLSKSRLPFLIKTFMEDKNFPTQYKKALENQAQKLSLLETPALSKEQKNQLETPEQLSQSQILAITAQQIGLGQKITKESVDKLIELAPNNPENHYFLGILQKTNLTYGNIVLEGDVFNLSKAEIQKNHQQSVILLQSAIDKPRLFSNNLDEVYEKRVNLTSNDDYSISEDGSKEWLEDTQRHHLVGLSLLIILSNIEDVAKDNVIKSLSTVGLINQAHHIAKEELAKLMQAYT